MKLPADDIKLIKDLHILLAESGAPIEYIVKVKKDLDAYRKWAASSQVFIPAHSFATGGGVKSPDNTTVTRPGVYRYFYKPTGECVYIGWSGSLYDRTGAGNTVARRILETGKPPAQTTYSAIEKMIAEDPNLENWTISYMETFSGHIATQEEERLILAEKPRFNDPKMAGK